MADSSPNPIAGFLRKMNRELFFKIARGQFDYEADMAQLDKYLVLARQSNSPEATGNIYITVGMLQSSVGRFVDVLATMDAAIEAFEQTTDPQQQQRVMGCRTHKGEIYAYLGDNQKAIEIFTDVLAHAESVSEEQDFFGDRYLLWVAMGRGMLVEGHSDIAEQYFRRVLNTPDKVQTQHIVSIIEANVGLGEVHRQRNEFTTAQDCAKLALDIAIRQNDEREQFYSHCAIAHIVASQHNDPEPHYSAAINVITPILKSANNVVALLDEARYHQRHLNHDQAARFATLAQTHFHAVGVAVFDEELGVLLAH